MHQPLKNGPDGGISDYGNVIVTGGELAAVLGLSEPHIFTLKRRHVIQSIRARKSEYRLGESVRAYIQYKCGQESAANADFHRERALKEKANRELRQILVQQTRAQLHHCDDVRDIMEDSNNEIRSKLLAFAKRLALSITGKHDPTEVKDRIESGVRELLSNLSKYRACDYYRRHKIAPSLTDQLDSEPQPGRVGWKKGRPRPEASESNRQRWAANPEKLTETVRKMNAAKQAAADEVRGKLSAAAKKRWATIPLEQKLAHLEKMRRPAGRNHLRVRASSRSEISAKLKFSNSASLFAASRSPPMLVRHWDRNR
jgi:hypothetical protein